jgi:hypothetical protein
MARNIYVCLIYIYFSGWGWVGLGGLDAAEDLSWVIRKERERERVNESKEREGERRRRSLNDRRRHGNARRR